ncbi:MAG TPA: HDIG domain-containing protein [Bacteroidales bacterium]|nr:HDIG domain-containing protein [Bacteroidales bacterium]
MPLNSKTKRVNKSYFFASAIIISAVWQFNTTISIPELAGSLLISCIFMIVLYLFLLHFSPDVLKSDLKTLFLLVLIVLFTILVKLTFYFPGIIIQMIPFTLAAILVRTFYDARLSFFVLVSILLICGFIGAESFEFIVINFLAATVAILTLRAHRKGKLVFAAFFVFLTFVIIYTGLSIIKPGGFHNIDAMVYASLFINSILVLLSYPVIFVFENRFMYLSDSTLLEYADTSQPLLRKLADEAPGSFQHSLQVANLAEEAARITGANPLLARVGALYHDIGKIASPDYYTENQKNAISPHTDLDPGSSAKLIINHVNSGIILAKNYKLPQQIIDFIRTHHGTSVAYYFYKKHAERRSIEGSDLSEFMYPGPKPFTKETAIIMMADAVEASSRSMEKQTEDSIGELVERIVLLQEQDGQYSDAPFTYREISDIKESFKRRLSMIYHKRVAYPAKS